MGEDFYAAMDAQIEDMAKLFLEKNQVQYTDNGQQNPLANFKKGALMKFDVATEKEMFEVAHDWVRKHLAFLENATVATPKIEESLERSTSCVALSQRIKASVSGEMSLPLREEYLTGVPIK